MTRTTNARVAGFTFLIYIAAGVSSMALARYVPVTAVLALVGSFSALVLGVTLYVITRDEDPDLAMMALACRVIEAVPGHGEIYFAAVSLPCKRLPCWCPSPRCCIGCGRSAPDTASAGLP